MEDCSQQLNTMCFCNEKRIKCPKSNSNIGNKFYSFGSTFIYWHLFLYKFNQKLLNFGDIFNLIKQKQINSSPDVKTKSKTRKSSKNMKRFLFQSQATQQKLLEKIDTDRFIKSNLEIFKHKILIKVPKCHKFSSKFHIISPRLWRS